jgi:hypothetical protein
MPRSEQNANHVGPDVAAPARHENPHRALYLRKEIPPYHDRGTKPGCADRRADGKAPRAPAQNEGFPIRADSLTFGIVRRVGYLVPEFPGQTHIFFWREHQGLLARGIELDLVSTRRPPRNIISHDWSEDAMSRTMYLYPPGRELLGRAGVELLRANPVGWARCIASIARAEGLDAKGRARLFALAAMGAELAALARQRAWKHVHVHSCGDSAHIAMFARLLSGLSYSITLHGPLHEYGPNQREKWRHASFAILISRVLDGFVREKLRGALPPVLDLAPMGVDSSESAPTSPGPPGSRSASFARAA